MLTYMVKVFTGDLLYAKTSNLIYIKLVGQEKESDRSWLMGAGSFICGSECTFTVSCSESLGDLIMVMLDKQPLPLFPHDMWFVEKVEVKSPEGKTYIFPMYHWIKDSETHIFREGTAKLEYQDENPLAQHARNMEKQHRKKEYSWEVYEEGLPYCMKVATPDDLPPEVVFSFTKNVEFKWTAIKALVDMKLSHLGDCTDPWSDFDSLYTVFSSLKNNVSDYVQKHWQDDAFFGYQYLNGLNPNLIQRCSVLPLKLPLKDEMVPLEGGAKLSAEMEKGNIYLCDYKILDSVPTSVINGVEQHLCTPLVLLHKTPEDQLKPVAIQLSRTPGEDSPIFFPSDPEYDWLLAKTFVRSSEFNLHELVSHLLRTHLLSEVFTVALLRNIPRVHPLYKLLIPHTRYTLQINTMARETLISEDGSFTLYTASGGQGTAAILKRAMSSITYSSLCLPKDIKERGVLSVPQYYYRDDGLQLWNIIQRFVSGIMKHYYMSDEHMRDDTELQDYIRDIYEYGFLSNANSGIPECFYTVNDLVEFLTMIIFTASAQHAAVNSGQMDFGGWMPNFPTSLKLPPPKTKGIATEQTLLQTLPDINTTVHGLASLWILSTQSSDFVRLGDYPHEHFTEDECRRLIKVFQKELSDLDDAIDSRNKDLPLPYTYMQPKMMENSVAL